MRESRADGEHWSKTGVAGLTKIGLTPEDALFLEAPNDNHYAISVAAREDNIDSEAIKVLQKSVGSDAVRTYLEEEHGESLVPSF